MNCAKCGKKCANGGKCMNCGGMVKKANGGKVPMFGKMSKAVKDVEEKGEMSKKKGKR